MAVTVRAMTREDIAGGLRLSRASGWNQLEEDWRLAIDPPSEGWVAERDGAIIGTSVLVRYGSLAWVAMMLVDPAERRTGLGSRLLAEALAGTGNAQCVGLDATPAGEPLYRRAGFADAYMLVRAKITVDATRFESTRKARLMSAGDLESACRMDCESIGADRGRLLESLFRRAPECAWIVPGRGFCLGRPGFRYHQLGPVVAEDHSTARDLVSSCLAGLGGRTFAIDVPRADDTWLAWLRDAGFIEERPFLRMFLRGDLPARRLYGICGPEFA